jgi:hypothetical protein
MHMKKIVGMLVLVGFTQLVGASGQDCRDAKHGYREAKGEIPGYLRLYANCISSNTGDDDCESEFTQLKSAQEEFEDAVSNIQSECE